MDAHRKTNGLLAALALGELGPVQSSEVRAHLDACRQCSEKLKQLDQLLIHTTALSSLSADETTCALAREGLLRTVAAEEAREPALRCESPAARLWRALTKSRTAKVAAAAVLVLVGLGVVHLASPGTNHGAAFASEAVKQIEEAKAITWKITLYTRVTSKDRQRTWIETETRQEAYKSPGLYRETYGEADGGQVRSVTIADTLNRVELILVPREKRAILRGVAAGSSCDAASPSGPFVWVGEKLRKTNDLQWVETRETPRGKVNVFRTAFWDKANNEAWSYDFWIDANSKRLVAVCVPGADIYDPEKDPVWTNPRETEWYSGTGVCSVQHDINFDAELDDSLFRLEPPEGYTVQEIARPQVTEKEMVDYLRVLAEYHNGTFPDQVLGFNLPADEINRIWHKPKEERTAAEQKLLDTMEHYKMAGLNEMPISHFLQEHAVPDSFRYLGKGVKLGDKGRIVCWYKLKDASGYRAVYGDLSVKAVLPEDLPLDVEP